MCPNLYYLDGLVHFNIVNNNMITFSSGGIVTPQGVKVLYPGNGGPGIKNGLRCNGYFWVLISW